MKTTCARRGFDHSAIDRMKLVKWVVKKWGSQRPLAGWKVLLIQHQLENHFAQLVALTRMGVDPRDVYWIDIPYTSSPTIRAEAVRHGVPKKHLLVHKYDPRQRYSAFQRGRVANWIESFTRKHGTETPLLVLDDGGYFLEAMVCFKGRLKRLAVVEQTSRGIRKYRSNAAVKYYCSDVPVVDVATSRPKSEAEAPIIGRAVCGAISTKLKYLHPRCGVELRNTNILLLGYGRIGKAIADALVADHRVDSARIRVADTKRSRQQMASQHGLERWNRKDFSVRFGVVIGSTGTRSFDIWNYPYLEEHAVLISASSGAVEMAREEFIEFAGSSGVDDVYIQDREAFLASRIHDDVVLQVVDRTVTVANGGYPINFEKGRLARIRAEDIQITVAMMLYGAQQAVRTTRKGLVQLDAQFCADMMRTWESIRHVS